MVASTPAHSGEVLESLVERPPIKLYLDSAAALPVPPYLPPRVAWVSRSAV